MEAFTRQEELGDEEKYYCSECKKHQLASKKLQIWRLPPILIVHLKRFYLYRWLKYDILLIKLFYFRFHFVNGRWIKSHKIVDFPNKMLDPTDYLAAIPQQTILRHKELVTLGKFWKWIMPISTQGIWNSTFLKVRTFLKGQKNLKQSPTWFDIY